jgi:ketosteroid isomerase-like protein
MTQDARHADARVDRVIRLFESLTRADAGRLGEFYATDASFKDPHNDVRGVPAIERIFTHMFDALESPRFVIREAVAEGGRCVLTWDFHLAIRGRALTIHGASLLEFAADGRIAHHRDYWDAAEELYEKLPLLGGLMRWIKRRLAVPQG